MKNIKIKDIVVYEDDNIIVINKPSGLNSLSDRFNETLVSVYSLIKGLNQDYIMCHRLDRETSGCMVIAKNKAAHREISMQFEHRQISKEYHAIAQGRVFFENFEVDLPIFIAGQRKVKIDRERGKKAQTIFNVLEAFKNYTLIQCKPITGRMHQIRVHLSSQNSVIAADTMYGGKMPYFSELRKRKYTSSKEAREENPMINRVALHAFKLSFRVGEKQLEIEAPYPKDFSVMLKMLRKYDVMKK